MSLITGNAGLEDDLIRKSGWLRKECKKLGRVPRFFRLSGQLLTNHRDENSSWTWRMDMSQKVVKGFAQQRKLVVSSTPENPSEPGFQGDITVFANSQAEFHAWYNTLVRSANHDVREKYNFISLLGSGSFGNVVLGRNKNTLSNVAIKIIQRGLHRDSRENIRILREIGVLRSTNHENLVKAIAFYESVHATYIVMELIEGGTLQELCSQVGNVQEVYVKGFMKDILKGVAYLHDRGIVHRDLKLTNVLRVGHGLRCSVKVIDFGLANFIHRSSMSESMLSSPVGTSLYMAPEIVQDLPYDESVDCWSIGVIVYRLLTGRFPFQAVNRVALAMRILQDDISFETVTSENLSISDNAKDLIRRFLEKSPTYRISARDALEHPWFN